jgi:hypothetical protein
VPDPVQQLHAGMPYAEIVAILGKPDASTCTAKFLDPAYWNAPVAVSHEALDHARGRYCQTWKRPEGFLNIVVFDGKLESVWLYKPTNYSYTKQADTFFGYEY